MTRDEFTKKMTISPEEYEESVLKADLVKYYDFKLMINYANVIAKEKIKTSIVLKRKIMMINSIIEKYQKMFNDEEVEFFFGKNIDKEELNVLLERLGDSKLQIKYKKAIARLLLYHEYSNKSVKEILSYFKEDKFVFELKKCDPQKFNIWFDVHPDIKEEEYLASYENSQEKTK